MSVYTAQKQTPSVLVSVIIFFFGTQIDSSGANNSRQPAFTIASLLIALHLKIDGIIGTMKEWVAQWAQLEAHLRILLLYGGPDLRLNWKK